MKIHDSRDETQRVVTLTYSNVRQNKDGNWIGTRMTVDRSINDIIPVDDALNESMLNCSKQIDNTDTGNDENNTEENETDNNDIRGEETNSISNECMNDKKDDEDDGEEITSKAKAKVEDKNCNMEEKVQIRRSERVRKQRYNPHSDDIGNDDDKSDQDYIPEG